MTAQDDMLIGAARPVIDQLAHDLTAARMSVILTDGQGHVVDRWVADPRHFVELQPVARVGAPISDPRSGALAGVIDLTCMSTDASALMLPLATRAAKEIEQRLIDDSGVTERFVLQRFLNERRAAKGPLVFITDRTMITNAAASRVVTPDDEPILRENAERIAAAEADISVDLVLRRGSSVIVRGEPVLDGTRLVATILRLTVRHDPHDATVQATSSGATFGWKSLTHTERTVTDLVAQGLTNREAAERLFLSPHTVGFHLRAIYRKLDVGSRVELTRLVLERTMDQHAVPVPA
jgi:DNA-binding CsgD family transcriptional regulator